MACTSDRFVRKADGKAVGLECVTTVLEEVSAYTRSAFVYAITLRQRTFACSTTNGASQGHIFLPSATVEQVTTVVAEDKRADCRHDERFVAV